VYSNYLCDLEELRDRFDSEGMLSSDHSTVVFISRRHACYQANSYTTSVDATCHQPPTAMSLQVGKVWLRRLIDPPNPSEQAADLDRLPHWRLVTHFLKAPQVAAVWND
jgi:hypothetical protein